MDVDQDDSVDATGVTRRGFLQDAAATTVLGGLMSSPSAAAAQGGKKVSLRNVRHVIVDHSEETYCGRPRQCGIKSLGDGELAVLYYRAPCSYAGQKEGAANGQDDCISRAEVVLRRSCDHGQTWPSDSDVVLWSNATPLGKCHEFLLQDPGERQILDMSKPEAMFFFGHAPTWLKRYAKLTRGGWTSELRSIRAPRSAQAGPSTVFQIRSADKGCTWEHVPLVLDPPDRDTHAVWKDNHPLVTMPDGALVGAVESERGLWLYGSECQGMTWQCLSTIATAGSALSRPCCAGLILLPSGRIQCYLLVRDTLCVVETDNCFSWSELRPIARGCHSPWPLRLRDGRIVVIFARRQSPAAIAAILSEDDGKTWSAEATIRDDTSGSDIGYPVAVEADPGRVFTAYQYQRPDGNGLGGPRFIAGSSFKLG